LASGPHQGAKLEQRVRVDDQKRRANQDYEDFDKLVAHFPGVVVLSAEQDGARPRS